MVDRYLDGYVYACIAVDVSMFCTLWFGALTLVIWIDVVDVGLLPLVGIDMELKTWLNTSI